MLVRDRGNETTHAVHGIGKRLGILQKLFRGGLEEGKITLIVVELLIGGLWNERRGSVQCNHGGLRNAYSWTCRPCCPSCAVSY